MSFLKLLFEAEDRLIPVAEDQIKCPLIRAGRSACPHISSYVENREKPRRRYAIGALADLRCAESIPILTRLLDDGSEAEEYRGEALEALWVIDKRRVESLLGELALRNHYRGQVARRLLHGKATEQMTYVDAVICRHE